MPLPKSVDTTIRAQIESLMQEIDAVQQAVEKAGGSNALYRSKVPDVMHHKLPLRGDAFDITRNRFANLLSFLYSHRPALRNQIDDIRALEPTIKGGNALVGAIKAFKADYEAGMLNTLNEIIEADVVSDYMGQAEQLLGEGVPGQYDHVPAAVLAGVVLEDALRRLCQRQSPPIDLVTVSPNGDTKKKTFDPLIADLQKAAVFNKAKADQLRAWAKIRNYAAHGEFTEFNRADVEAMIRGIQSFIADYL
jgi:hypothetical protein